MAKMPRVYLDTCALTRLFDQAPQSRIRIESHAVEDFFLLLFQEKSKWVSSEVIEAEILNNPDSGTRSRILRLLGAASERVILGDAAFHRAEVLEKLGYGAFDALHLACAEQAVVEVLPTTDDRFIRQARRGLGRPAVQIENPVDWVRKVKP